VVRKKPAAPGRRPGRSGGHSSTDSAITAIPSQHNHQEPRTNRNHTKERTVLARQQATPSERAWSGDSDSNHQHAGPQPARPKIILAQSQESALSGEGTCGSCIRDQKPTLAAVHEKGGYAAWAKMGFKTKQTREKR
jgi:hypothetical protein